jgi:hypothetical protein
VVEPCGGDVRGDWSAVASCFDEATFVTGLSSLLGLTCPSGATVMVTRSTAARTIAASFKADGTYTGTSTLSGSLDVQVPAACIRAGGTCDDLDAALGSVVGPSGGFVAAGCTGVNPNPCACSFIEGGVSNETGTYTISGTVLETTPAGHSPMPTPYCVSGSYLHFINLAGTAVASDAVAVRH